MRKIPSLKSDTSLKIDIVLIDRCKENNIEMKELIRSTYQLLVILDQFVSKDINEILQEIIREYDDYEYISLSEERKTVKTHITLQQKEAYQKIDKKDRLSIFNKLMSISINNIDYVNIKNTQKINSDPIINEYIIKFFMNKNADTEFLLETMAGLLAKTKYILKNNYVPDFFYKDICKAYLSKEDSEEFNKSNIVVEFLYIELKKIYFAMLITYKVPMNSKSSSGIAREVKKEYTQIYNEKYNKNIDLFINNEIRTDDDLNEKDQVSSSLNFVISLYKSDKEEFVLIVYLLFSMYKDLDQREYLDFYMSMEVLNERYYNNLQYEYLIKYLLHNDEIAQRIYSTILN